MNGCTHLQQSGTVLRGVDDSSQLQSRCVIRLVDDYYPPGWHNRFVAWNLLFASLIRAVRAR
jgi:hypothetical protein